MSGLDVKVDDQISKAIAAYAKRCSNLQPVFDEVGGSQVAEVQNRFQGEHGPDGAGWVGLAASTLAKKQGDTILRESAGLFDSVTHEASDKKAAIGTNHPLGPIHNYGGQAGRNQATTIPARPFMGVSEDGKAEILAILRDHLEAA